jgi:hypothetical protein
VEKVRERLSVNKQRLLTFMEILNLKKLNKVEGKDQCCFEISNRSADLKNAELSFDINSEKLREDIKISAKGSKT